MKVRLLVVVLASVSMALQNARPAAAKSKSISEVTEESFGPIVTLRFFSVSKLTLLPDGTYSARLDLTGPDQPIVARFGPEGLGYMSNAIHRTRSTRYSRSRLTAASPTIYVAYGRASTVRHVDKRGAETSETVYWLLGNQKIAKLGGANLYRW